jgi:vacuolar-type H+-ATPase subunit H
VDVRPCRHGRAAKIDGEPAEVPEEVAVPRLADFLYRFRFHGVPGAPSAAGVPLDRTAAVQDELAPIFSLLEDARRRAAAVVAEAEQQADQRRTEASVRALRIVSEAQARTSAVRAETVAVRMAVADRDRSALVAAAEAEVDRIESVTAERLPGVVQELVDQVLATGAGAP